MKDIKENIYSIVHLAESICADFNGLDSISSFGAKDLQRRLDEMQEELDTIHNKIYTYARD